MDTEQEQMRRFGESDKITEAKEVLTLIRGELASSQSIGSSGSGIPQAQYVTLATDSVLTNERVLTAGDGIDLTDGGAGSTVTLAVDVTDILGAGLTETSNNLVLGTPTTLTNATTNSVSGTTHAHVLDLSGFGLDDLANTSLVDPNADRVVFWDDSDGAYEWLVANEGLAITINNLNLDWGTPTIGTIEPDDSEDAGAGTNPARSDHQHAIVCGPPGADSVNLSGSTEGTGTSFARADHTHNLDESITPTWTGAHTFDDGTGDSPALNFVGGTNNDTAKVYLADDATATDSDLIRG
jgi:hypothetical protein